MKGEQKSRRGEGGGQREREKRRGGGAVKKFTNALVNASQCLKMAQSL